MLQEKTGVDYEENNMESGLKIDMTASFSREITAQDLDSYAGIIGDYNPIHMDREVAVQAGFRERVAHGMFVGGLISTVIGMKFPGSGTIYLEQDLKFRHPAYLGDTCTAYVEMAETLNEKKGIYRLNTWIENQDNIVVSEGYAVVKCRREKQGQEHE